MNGSAFSVPPTDLAAPFAASSPKLRATQPNALAPISTDVSIPNFPKAFEPYLLAPFNVSSTVPATFPVGILDAFLGANNAFAPAPNPSDAAISAELTTLPTTLAFCQLTPSFNATLSAAFPSLFPAPISTEPTPLRANNLDSVSALLSACSACTSGSFGLAPSGTP